MSDDILSVKDLFNDTESNEWLFICPHCGEVRGIEKDESLSLLIGEQYQDNLCGNWFEISSDVGVTIKTVEELHKLSDDRILELSKD